MTTKTLRTLAREYAEGAVDKESYRKARDAYFKAVLAGTVKVQPIEYRPLVESQDLDATVEKTTMRPADPRKNSAPEERPQEPARGSYVATPGNSPAVKDPPFLLVTTILLIVAAVGVSVALLIPAGEEETETTMTETETVTDTVPENTPAEALPMETPGTATAPAEMLIKDFLAENNWSDTSLREFRNDWQALSPDEQEQGLASPLRVKLVNAIHQKLVEERALMGLGDPEQVIARQHKLVNFASELEISDPRLKVEGENNLNDMEPTETETSLPEME